MNTTINLLGENLRNAQVILFMLGPHWVKTPPLSLVFLENFLSQKGYKAKIVDLNIIFYNLLKPSNKEWLSLNPELEDNVFGVIKKEYSNLIEDLLSQIINSKAKILGFSLYGRNRKATFDFISEIDKRTQSKLFILGGPEVLFEFHRNSFFEEINPDNSYFVLGEGELPLLNICEHAYKNKEIQFDSHKGKKLISYEEIDNLDSLPMLNFNGLKLQLYNPNILPLLSCRGCIKKCSFCSEYKLYKKFRQHSPGYIVKLIGTLIKKHSITTFSFQDSLINADLQWLDKFCSLIIKKGLKIKWEAQLSIRNGMKEDLLQKMKLSGCYNLFVGLESASGKMLKLMQKGYSAEEAEAFLANLRQAGLHFETSLITGFPDEDEEDFKQTLSFLRRNKTIIPKVAQVNPFVEYPPSQTNKTSPEFTEISKQRVRKIIKVLEEEDIKYTPSFINNLLKQ